MCRFHWLERQAAIGAVVAAAAAAVWSVLFLIWCPLRALVPLVRRMCFSGLVVYENIASLQYAMEWRAKHARAVLCSGTVSRIFSERFTWWFVGSESAAVRLYQASEHWIGLGIEHFGLRIKWKADLLLWLLQRENRRQFCERRRAKWTTDLANANNDRNIEKKIVEPIGKQKRLNRTEKRLKHPFCRSKVKEILFKTKKSAWNQLCTSSDINWFDCSLWKDYR